MKPSQDRHLETNNNNNNNNNNNKIIIIPKKNAFWYRVDLLVTLSYRAISVLKQKQLRTAE